jgi:hypothetical protein
MLKIDLLVGDDSYIYFLNAQHPLVHHPLETCYIIQF